MYVRMYISMYAWVQMQIHTCRNSEADQLVSSSLLSVLFVRVCNSVMC